MEDLNALHGSVWLLLAGEIFLKSRPFILFFVTFYCELAGQKLDLGENRWLGLIKQASNIRGIF